MNSRRALSVAAVLVCLHLALVAPMRAMIFYSTGSPAHNTTAPTGPLGDRGWQWVGHWTTNVDPHTYTGVPIGPHHFITAKHVGGIAGTHALVLNGVSYTTVRSFEHPNAEVDLRIWEVLEAFPSWPRRFPSSGNETLYTETAIFGRGKTRGADVHVHGTTTLRGWHWGGSTGTLRWGTNVVSQIASDKTPQPAGSGDRFLLYSLFEASGGASECHLAVGDSSGPVFIYREGAWDLAGIAVIVDGGFHTAPTGTRFSAAIFDRDGLYQNGALVPDDGNPSPSGFYSERLSSYAAWIDSVLATPLRATISLSNLSHDNDGRAHSATVTTNPAGLATTVTYDGSTTAPSDAGSYTVVATITASGYEATVAAGTFVINQAKQAVIPPAPPCATR